MKIYAPLVNAGFFFLVGFYLSSHQSAEKKQVWVDHLIKDSQLLKREAQPKKVALRRPAVPVKDATLQSAFEKILDKKNENKVNVRKKFLMTHLGETPVAEELANALVETNPDPGKKPPRVFTSEEISRLTRDPADLVMSIRKGLDNLPAENLYEKYMLLSLAKELDGYSDDVSDLATQQFVEMSTAGKMKKNEGTFHWDQALLMQSFDLMMTESEQPEELIESAVDAIANLQESTPQTAFSIYNQYRVRFPEQLENLNTAMKERRVEMPHGSRVGPNGTAAERDVAMEEEESYENQR